MSFEDLKVRAAMFFEQSVYQPETLHEIQELLREQVSALQATGQPVPEDLMQLELRLEKVLESPAE